ncbi:hypothetical protein ACFL3E_02100 [Patescibacteria group bacterium]
MMFLGFEISLDLLIFFFLSGVLIMTTFLSGISKIVYFFLSLYIVFLAYPLLPVRDAWQTLSNEARVGTELFIILAASLMISFIFSKLKILSFRKGSWLGSLVLSVLTAGFLLSGVVYLIKPGDLLEFSSMGEMLFNSSIAFFIWTLVPILGLFMTRSRRRDE